MDKIEYKNKTERQATFDAKTGEGFLFVEDHRDLEGRDYLVFETVEERSTRLKVEARRGLINSDGGMSRVVEDLVALLVTGDIIRIEDLPSEAQEKLARRVALRDAISGGGG